jgi:ketosteroid isomerase-like protein
MPNDVDVVLASNAALNRRDVDGMLAVYAPDAEVVDRRRVGFGSFAGRDELHGLYTGIVSSAASFHEDVQVRATGNGLVVAHCEVRAKLASDPNGPDVGAEYGFVVTVRDGLIARLELFDNGDDALAASGLTAG